MARPKKTAATRRKPRAVEAPGVRRVDLRELIPKGTILTMPDGKEATLPPIGSDEMAEMLILEELLGQKTKGAKGLVEVMRQVNAGINEYLQKHNPDLTDYSFPFGILPSLLGEIMSSGANLDISVSDEVRDAIAGDESSLDDALSAAQRLAEEHLERKEGEDAPLASAKRSRTRSSRSASTGDGGRNGGSERPGRSRSRTSRKSAASKSA